MNLKKENPDDPIPPTKAENQSPKKAYTPPRFAILNAAQAKAELTAKAIPGDASAKQLLDSISQLERSVAAEQRPTVVVELKLAVPGKWRAAELKLAGEALNIGHLAILRKYLDVCEIVMGEAGSNCV